MKSRILLGIISNFAFKNIQLPNVTIPSSINLWYCDCFHNSTTIINNLSISCSTSEVDSTPTT